MSVDLLDGERVLWQAKPARHTIFLRSDPRWMWFSLKFDAVLVVFMAVVFVLLNWWLGPVDLWGVMFGVYGLAVPIVLQFTDPFAWRFFTLRRTTYYVTDQRVVSVPGRRARSVPLTEIDNLAFAENADGSGYVRLDQRVMPDGFGNRTVAELIHVPDVREVVTLLSTLTGKTPVNVD